MVKEKDIIDHIDELYTMAIQLKHQAENLKKERLFETETDLENTLENLYICRECIVEIKEFIKVFEANCVEFEGKLYRSIEEQKADKDECDIWCFPSCN